jgi:hypothetical protein
VDSLPLGSAPLSPCWFSRAQCKKKITAGSIGGRLNSEGEKVMRKNAIRLMLMTILIIGINAGTCRAMGPFPPQFPPMAVK